jgi:hypothetical protein
MTIAAATGPVLDFNPAVGMVIDGAPPEDPDTDPCGSDSIALDEPDHL